MKAILFDLDNTLIDRQLAFRKYAEQFVDQFIQVASETKREQTIEYIQKADRDGYRDKKELYMELLDQLMWKRMVSIEELLDYWFSQFFKCTVLMPGALTILEKIKSNNIKAGIITNGSVHSQNKKIDQVHIRQYFQTIIISGEVNIKKPDRKIFDIALRKLNVEPEMSWFIGDHPINDVIGAAEAGMNAVWFQRNKWDQSLPVPQKTIRSLIELEELLIT